MATFPRVGMYSLGFATAADGTQHVLFNEGLAERVVHGACAERCADPASWSMTTLASTDSLGVTAVGAEGLGFDSSGRLHVLISGVPPFGGSANRAVYATCAGDCTNGSSWTLLDLTPVAQGNPIGTNGTFMVSADGSLAFLTQGQRNSFPSRYVGCTSGCGAISAWTGASVLDGNPLFARRDAEGVIHIVFDQGVTDSGDGLHFYGRCASGCAQSSGWEISPLGFIYRSGGHTAGFAVTPSGKVFLAYNQGNAAAATEDNGKLFINSCTGANCLDLGTWGSFSVGALGDGSDGAALSADGEVLRLANTSGFELHLRTCAGGGCQNAAGWSAPGVIDSSAQMNEAVPPDLGSACPGTSESASWWPNLPAIGAGASGVVVGHAPYAIVKCPGVASPGRYPSIGRIYATF